MKDIKEFYTKLADLIEEYDVEISDGGYKASPKPIFVGVKGSGYYDRFYGSISTKSLMAMIGVSVTVNGTLNGNPISDAKGQIKDGRLNIEEN